MYKEIVTKEEELLTFSHSEYSQAELLQKVDQPVFYHLVDKNESIRKARF